VNRKHRTLVSTFGLLAVAIMFAVPAGTLAAVPVQTMQPFEDQDDFQACGLLIHAHSQGHLTETTWFADQLDVNGFPIVVRHVFREEGTGSYSANGKALAFSFAHVFKDSDIVSNGPATVTLDDGTQVTGASYSFHSAFLGDAISLRVPGGRVVAVTAGRLDLDQTIVVFANGDALTLDVENVEVHGPQPLDNGGFCRLMTQYLG
jgi:hypothetical protein